MKLAKIKKPTDLRKNLFDALDETAKGKVYVIPHKGGESVLLAKEELDDLSEQLEIQKDINQALLDASEGRTSSLEEVRKHFDGKFRKWKRK